MRHEPITSIDERFSDPGAAPTDWATTLAVLREAQLMWISTVRDDGRPHVTPLVAVWHEGAVYFCTGPEEQKAVNLGHHPDVVLTTGCSRWEDGVDVMVEGRATRVKDRPLLEALAGVWAEKWDGSWQYEPHDDGFGHDDGGVGHVYEVVPAKVLAFAKGTAFSHTTHRFG